MAAEDRAVGPDGTLLMVTELISNVPWNDYFGLIAGTLDPRLLLQERSPSKVVGLEIDIDRVSHAGLERVAAGCRVVAPRQ